MMGKQNFKDNHVVSSCKEAKSKKEGKGLKMKGWHLSLFTRTFGDSSC